MNRWIPIFALIFSTLLSSCAITSSRMISSTRSPDIILDPEIHRILLVDRSRPSSQAATVVEGVITGEWMGTDRQGRREVIQTIDQIMAHQDRFKIVRSDIELKGSPSGGRMEEPLSQDEVMALCKEYETQAILMLEAFDSDGQNTATEAVSLGVGIATLGVLDPMNYPNNVRTSWRLYDGADGRILDEYETFITDDGWWAYSTLPPMAQWESVSQGARFAASQYAGRLIPMPIEYQRRYYIRASGANDEMLQAHRLVQAERWERAVDIWKSLYERSDRRKVRRRAAYNLAVASERNQDLDQALHWAEEAIILGDDRAVGYSADLSFQKEHKAWYEANKFAEDKDIREESRQSEDQD